MAGIAEMAQMAAILKYKTEGQQCQCGGNALKSNERSAKKDKYFTSYDDQSAMKWKQGGWRDLDISEGYKTAKNFNKKFL